RVVGVERMQLVGLEVQHAVGGGFEVVEQLDARRADGGGEDLLIELPGQVGRLRLPFDNRPGDAAAAGLELLAFEELAEDLFERGVVFALEGLVAQLLQRAAGLLEQGQDCLGAADVACDKHCFLLYSVLSTEYEKSAARAPGWCSSRILHHPSLLRRSSNSSSSGR